MKEVRDFILLSLLGLFLINFTFVSALVISYGNIFTLNPGENYTINIPFIVSEEIPSLTALLVCGKAQTIQGDEVEDVEVKIYLLDNKVNESITDSNGRYCITLPAIESPEQYSVKLEYENETDSGDAIQLGSNDYDLNFDNHLVFSKSQDKYAILSGSIDNKDAKIENGRVEVNLQYWADNLNDRYLVFDYQKYFVNIGSNEEDEFPNSELNLSWKIPDNAELGEYKFYVKTSFNAKEKASHVYFNLTA